MDSEVRIEIVDDEETIRSALRTTLGSAGYKLAEASNGRLAIEVAHNFHPHLIILDLGLPDRSGLDVLRDLRTWSRVPVIILSVEDNEQVKVQLLDSGADDYLTKPFGSAELLARVRVTLRNVGLIEATPVFTSGDLEVDVTKRKIRVAGREVKLTATEFSVLALLVRDHGKVVLQSTLMKQIWGSHAEGETHYLRIYINQLRKKLEAKPSEPEHILTEPGVGYRLI